MGHCYFIVLRSGKTLAFGVPAIMHVLQKQKSKTSKRVNPLCLVLSPTRELAQQVCAFGLEFCVNNWLVTCNGGFYFFCIIYGHACLVPTFRL